MLKWSVGALRISQRTLDPVHTWAVKGVVVLWRYKVLSARVYLFCRRLLRALVCNDALHSFVLIKIAIKHSKITSFKSSSLASRSLPLNSEEAKTSCINKTNCGRVHCMHAGGCLFVWRHSLSSPSLRCSHLLCDFRTFAYTNGREKKTNGGWKESPWRSGKTLIGTTVS